MLIPAVVYVFIFSYLPMYGVQIAFSDYSTKKGIMGSDWVGLQHFIRFFKYPNFTLLLKNTLGISIYALLTFPLPILFALLLKELRKEKVRSTVQMISYMPYFMSTVVICSIITMLLNENHGIICDIVEFFGGERRDFLSNPESFNDIYVWSEVWKSLGWDSIIYVAALSSVPPDLIEAAKLDGAGKICVARHIYIPHILPTVVIVLILNCGHLLSIGFEKAYLLQNPLNLSASQIISTYVYEIGIRGGQFSYSTAISFFNNVANLVLLCTVNLFAKKTANQGIW